MENSVHFTISQFHNSHLSFVIYHLGRSPMQNYCKKRAKPKKIKKSNAFVAEKHYFCSRKTLKTTLHDKKI